MKEELEDETATPSIKLSLKRQLVEGAGTPATVQHFMLTRVGKDILLEAGFFDLVELKDALDVAKPGEEIAITLYVRDRLIMGVQTLRQLRSAVDQILQQMDKGQEDSDDSY